MPESQLYPLEVNPQTEEPFLRPPIPYRDEHADEWLPPIIKQSGDILAELREEERSHPGGPLKLVGGCPVRYIREVLPDGTDVYLGDIGINRAQMEEVLDPDERKRAVETNNEKAVGDPSIVWAFGDYLTASHHGRGIMSAAMGTILHNWAIPRMGVRRMVGYTFTGNEGSRRVFEKNGFRFERTLENGKVVRGERKTLNYLRWEYRSMGSLIRPATPGFLVTLAATILLACVSFSVPLFKSIYFLKASLSVENQNGYITSLALGMSSVSLLLLLLPQSLPSFQDINALVGDSTSIQIPDVIVKWLTYVLVLHIVAFGLAAVSAFFGLLAHVREMAMSCFSSCISGLAATVALVAFIFDIAIFFVAKSRMNSVSGGSASIGNAVWLTLAAWLLLFFSGCFYGVGRCCIKRRSRDGWGKKDDPENGFNSSDQLRLDAVKAEADRKARQAQPEGGLPAFHEYDPSQPLKARVDGEEVLLEEDTPYRDNQSISTAGNAGMGTYGRSARGYAGGGYIQAPPGTRAVDSYNRPQRRGSTLTHTTATTVPSMYPPSSSASAPSSGTTAAVYDPPSDNRYNLDPYSPQAYGHVPGATSYNPQVQQPHVPYDPFGGFSSDTYNATATMADHPYQQPYGAGPARSPTLQPDHNYILGDPYGDPYYGHYQSISNTSPPPMSQSPPAIGTQIMGVPTSTSPVRGPRGLKSPAVMAPPQPASPEHYDDSPPTYEPGPVVNSGRWGTKG
ncbi:hypothetical protein JVU11DRAFT_4957 [Chiua virens]|nr:hypothetical protein JVU11DRAFT_4957 [Chiua virens]